jgi:hypothetical protein
LDKALPPIATQFSVSKTMQLRSGKTTTFMPKEDAKFMKDLAEECDNWQKGLMVYRNHEEADDAELVNALYLIRGFVKFADRNLETIIRVNDLYWDDDNQEFDGIFESLRIQKESLTESIFEVPKSEIHNLTELTKMSIILAMDIIKTTENILKKI